MENQESLREEYNPEGSELRRLQLRMLDMLVVVDEICRRHDIPYWIEGGTLLGAVRHEGFIPWDDDLDIALMKKDYVRLLKCLKEELPAQYRLQTHETDRNYYLAFAKIRETDSEIKETGNMMNVMLIKEFISIFFPWNRFPIFFKGIFLYELSGKKICPPEDGHISLRKWPLRSCFGYLREEMACSVYWGG